MKNPFGRRKKVLPQSPRVLGPEGDRALATLKAIGLDPLKALEQLVTIDSITTNIGGVQTAQKLLAEKLSHLGFKIDWEINPRGAAQSADLLIATLPPSTASGKTKWINFVSHSDTVLGREHVGAFSVSEDGRTARGSGVIDNKGGLVVALTGLELYLRDPEAKNRKHGFRFISSPNEEGGSVGFNDRFREFANDAVLALGFEPALDNGAIISSRRGNRWYHIKITGSEAHAGRSKGEHVNAAHELGIQLSKLHKLNDPKKDVAVNAGHISGGVDRYNVICGFAELKLDTRFSSFQTRDRLHRKVLGILDEKNVWSRDRKKSASVTFELVDDCPPFASTALSRKLVKEYVNIITEIEGQAAHHEKAGGAGDVNYMSAKSVVVIDGLGPIGGRMHTKDEFVHIPSLATRSLALNRFLKTL